jgi:hypothetical protein
MPQLQPLVLTDREPTPVDHTFLPSDITGGVGTVIESSGVPIGVREVTVGLSKTAAGAYKPRVRLILPIVVNETINGVTTPKVVRIARADVVFTFDGSSTEQERKNVVGMLQDALDPSKVLVNDTVVKLQGVY